MINPNDLRQKADKQFFKIAKSVLLEESCFPLIIAANKQITGEAFGEWKNAILPLYEESKENKRHSYSIDWKDKRISGIPQKVPSKIFFETPDDFLHFTKRIKDFEAIKESIASIEQKIPKLKSWAINNLPLVLAEKTNWPDLIKVCLYFINHPPPYPHYIRELPIEVHSKFIEQNNGMIKKLLDTILPEEQVNKDESDFSARYELKNMKILTQIRILDDALKPELGYDECALSLEGAAFLKWTPQRTFIIENKACFYSFPQTDKAVAIFGEGFKARLSRHFQWLDGTEIYCWFDLDAAGFEMLNLVRQQYRDAKSFLMDSTAFQLHSQFVVPNSVRAKKLDWLNKEEQSTYEFLVTHQLRLEQERLSHKYVLDQLKNI